VRSNLTELRSQARDLFLGRGDVVGIAESDDDPGGLIFMLKKPSSASQRPIKHWATSHRVKVQFQVVGPLRLSS
jgi:hypothetical protein